MAIKQLFVYNRGKIIINGLEIPRDLFSRFEPHFSSDYLSQIRYKPGGPRVVQSSSGVYEIPGEWGDGDRYISRYKDFYNILVLEQNEESRIDKVSEKMVENVKKKRKTATKTKKTSTKRKTSDKNIKSDS